MNSNFRLENLNLISDNSQKPIIENAVAINDLQCSSSEECKRDCSCHSDNSMGGGGCLSNCYLH